MSIQPTINPFLIFSLIAKRKWYVAAYIVIGGLLVGGISSVHKPMFYSSGWIYMADGSERGVNEVTRRELIAKFLIVNPSYSAMFSNQLSDAVAKFRESMTVERYGELDYFVGFQSSEIENPSQLLADYVDFCNSYLEKVMLEDRLRSQDAFAAAFSQISEILTSSAAPKNSTPSELYAPVTVNASIDRLLSLLSGPDPKYTWIGEPSATEEVSQRYLLVRILAFCLCWFLIGITVLYACNRGTLKDMQLSSIRT